MIIDLRLHKKLQGGFSASVFAIEDKAYKLFSSIEVPPRHTTEGRREIFRSQCAAFDAASGDALLKIHVPTFFGPCPIEDVIDADGRSIKDRYLLDCCYALELLSGSEMKVVEAKQTYSHIAEIVIRFTGRSIRTSDASVFNYSDPYGFKVIDIEMED